GSVTRAEERSFTETRRCGVKVSKGLTRARRSAAALALDPIPAHKKAEMIHIHFAELDKHNCRQPGNSPIS
ncbi:MAG: hypothetical protein ACR2IV_00905, partial [Bryobacteraceae bacterium]